MRAVIGAVAALALLAGVSASARTSAPPALKNGGTLDDRRSPRTRTPSTRRSRARSSAAWSSSHMCEKLYDLEREAADRPAARRGAADVLDGQADGHDQAPHGDQVQRRHAVQRRRREEVARPAQDAQGLGARERARAGQRRSTRQGNTRSILHLKAPLLAAHGAARRPRRDDHVAEGSSTTLGDKFATNPVCVGPFMFKDRVAGDHITLVKSPYYYDKKKVHLDTIVFKIITDPRGARRRTCARATSTSSDRIAVDRRCRRSQQRLERCASCKSTVDRLPGHHDQHREQERARQGRTTNIGTPIAKSADLRHGVRAGARPQRRSTRSSSAARSQPDCFPIAPGEPVVRRRRRGSPCNLTANVAAAKAAFKASGAAPDVDRAPDDRHRPGRRAARPGDPGDGEADRLQRRCSTRPSSSTSLNRADAGKFDTFAVGWSGRVDPDGNIYQLRRRRPGSQNDSGYSNAERRLRRSNERAQVA